MEAFVYCWTDTLTGKLYVGSHKGSDKDGYVCSSKYMMEEYRNRQSDFNRTIIAHGDYKDILALETSILQSADAAGSKEFYNKHNNNGNYRSHTVKSDECKNKMRKARIGKTRSEESKIKQSKTTSGSNNHFFGKTHSEASRLKMSESKNGIYVGGGNPNAKAIFYNGIKYETKKEMTAKTGISLYVINKMIANKEVVPAK